MRADAWFVFSAVLQADRMRAGDCVSWFGFGELWLMWFWNRVSSDVGIEGGFDFLHVRNPCLRVEAA